MVGSKFVVFGGQAEGVFFNELWSFDLNSRKRAAETCSCCQWLTPVFRPSPNEGDMGID